MSGRIVVTFERPGHPGRSMRRTGTPSIGAHPGTGPRGPVCAPYALASLTGRPIESFILKNYRGKVRGMFTTEIVTALASVYGASRVRVEWRSRPGPLWRMLDGRTRGIACVTGHAVAFDGYIVDDVNSPGPRWVHDCRSARRRCNCLIVVADITRPKRR